MRINITRSVIFLLLIVAPYLCFSETKEEERFYIAARAFSDGFYDASLSLFKKFISDFSDTSLNFKARVYIAKCYYYKENYVRALETFTEIRSLNPPEAFAAESCYWSGLIYFKGKDFSKSADYLKKLIDEYPGSTFFWPAYYLMADSSLKLGKDSEAEEIFNKIIEKSKNKEVLNEAYSQLLNLYFRKKSYSRVISLGQKYLKEMPEGSLRAKVYFYLGESYYNQGEWGEALESYLKASGVNYDLGLADLIYQGIGFSYMEKDMKLKAKANIDRIKDKELCLFSQGVYYFKTKDYLQALEVFNIFLRNYTNSKFLIDAYLNKADLLYEMGRLNDSIYAYKYILDNFKSRQSADTLNKAHYGLAWCYLKNGKFKEAIDEFKNTLEYTDNPVVILSSQIQIADAYQETGEYGQALEKYNSILKSRPNTIYADYIQFQIGMSFLKKKDLEKAFLALRDLKNNFSSSKLIPQAQYYLAIGYFSQGDYTEAKSLLKDFIDKFPKNALIARVYYLYGKSFFNEKNYNAALLIFKRIVAKYNDNEIKELVYIDMGNVYLNLSLFAQAKKLWKDFLKKYPHSQYAGSVALYLGGLYEKEEDYVRAQGYYKSVISDYRGSSFSQEATLSLGHLYWNRGDLERAQNYFREAAKKQSTFGLKGKLYLAKILVQKGENEEALKIYDQLINAEAAISKAALLDKAYLLKEMKDYRQAITVFRKTIEADIDSLELRFSLGLCLEKVNKGRDAIEEYLKVIYAFDGREDRALDSYKKYKIKAYFRIARIYEKEGNAGSAKKAYKNIIDLGTNEAKIARVRLEELKRR